MPTPRFRLTIFAVAFVILAGFATTVAAALGLWSDGAERNERDVLLELSLPTQPLSANNKVNDSDPSSLGFAQNTGYSTKAPAQNEREMRIGFAEAIIDSSLFEAGDAVLLPPSLTLAMATIFGWDIDFALDVRDGDSFSVMYEQIFVDGTKVKDGAILAAEFINQGQVYHAIRHTDRRGHSEYFSPKGVPMRKAFLRTPVDFTRISSYFGKRVHPILNTLRDHNGVDYAADTGTPIRAAGEGAVEFRGIKGGYGNTLILAHGRGYSTLYGHMARFAKGIRVGSRVKQGQIVGYVGSSGLATGPHLHYELRVGGVHRNPLSVKMAERERLEKNEMKKFTAEATVLLAQLNMYGQLNLGATEILD